MLASASDDSSIRLWQVSDEHPGKACKQAGICSGHQDSVLRVTWHSDGRLLASGPAVPMKWLQIARLAFATRTTTLYMLQDLQTQQLSCGSSLWRKYLQTRKFFMAPLSRHCRCLDNLCLSWSQPDRLHLQVQIAGCKHGTGTC